MTLVLSCCTADHVILVSDRRVTSSDGRIADDARNKGIAFDGLYVIGYSGLANVGKLSTDAWISLALASAQSADPFDDLTRFAANDVGRLPLPLTVKRLAVIAIGWVPDPQHGYLPIQLIMSNALTSDYSWYAEAQDEFVLYENRLDNPPPPIRRRWILCAPIGAEVGHAIWRSLVRNFNEAVRRNLGPESVARLLAEAIRAIARTNNTVSQNLVVMISPRPSRGPHDRMTTTVTKEGAGRPDLSSMACYLLAEGSADFAWTMPNFVINGWAFTDTTFAQDGGGFGMKTCIRREGSEPAGIQVIGADGVGCRLQAEKGKALEARIVRPGQPDQILPSERKPGSPPPGLLDPKNRR